MTLYLFVLIYLIVGTLIEVFLPEKKINHVLFWGMIGLLTFMLVFKYGQGADYWGYRNIYADAPWKRGFPLFWYTRDLHSELGFRFFINIFTAFGISHFYFYAVWSIVMMTFISIGIYRNSTSPMLSLLLLYPTVGLTYLFSGVRVGMVVSILFCFGIPAIRKQKWVWFIGIVIICALFHSSALFLLLAVPFVFLPNRKIVVLVPIAIVSGFLIAFTPLHVWLATYVGGTLERIVSREISWLGLAERTVMFLMLSVLYYYREDKQNMLIKNLYTIYIIGYCIAWGGMVSAYISQRASVPFKAMEIFLFPLLLYCNRGKMKIAVPMILIAVSSVMTYKNLDAYFPDKTAFEYHYIGVWEDKNEYLENWISDVTRWAENTYNENP